MILLQMFVEKLALRQRIHLKVNQSCSHTILYIDLCCVQIGLLLLVDFFLHFVQ